MKSNHHPNSNNYYHPNADRVPGTVLGTLLTHPISSLQQSHELGPLIILILHRKKYRHRKAFYIQYDLKFM